MLDFLKLKYNFTSDFFSSRSIYNIYDSVYNKTNGQDFFNKKSIDKKTFKSKIYVVNNIPPYFELRINSTKPYSLYKTHQLDGFLINLAGYNTIEDYMRDQFGPKSRSKIRRNIRRLESCFEIHYKMYYGKITREEYHFLFDKLYSMIIRRFSERGDTHDSIRNWDSIKKRAYIMILNKEASLFVIYDGNNPIDICLNYIHQNIINNDIRSYDINYSKFSLGYIDIMKQLEWCINNNFKIFDLSYGDLDYKRKWCNIHYEYEQHILYPSDSIIKKILAYGISQILTMKGFLRKKKVDILYNKIKALLKKNKESKYQVQEPIFQILEVTKTLTNENLTKIDITNEEYSFLRKPTYDFQFLNTESSRNISVYKMNDQNGIFFIEGSKKLLKISSVG